MNEQKKITASHLARRAFLYVRQSTLQQVFGNPESTRRQYDLRGRAIALGWPEESIVVIDSDLGQSGASAADREGFQKLVGEVGTGRAGIVMGLEVSRLARNSADWHSLLEICALTDTLILDEDGVYDPAHFNDRLLLGLKGTMSEAELHMLRARLQGGLMAKARRGELKIRLPVGFVYDEVNKVQLDPDLQVQDAVRLLFTTFRQEGSAIATTKRFYEQGLRFPSRPFQGSHHGELLWSELSYSRTLDVLHNPRYAGAFVLGRTRQRKYGSHGLRRAWRLPRDQWLVLLTDVHDGYITWDEFEENQKRLLDNNTRTAGGNLQRTPPREGPALLQGIVLCGICGKRMTVHYYQREGCKVPWYICPKGPKALTKEECQHIPGAGIDGAVGKLVVDTMSPMALEVALSVQEELEARFEEVDRLRREQVERARYDVDSARRRYMRVDPDNRLVAEALEAEWNEKLRALSEAQEDYERRRRDVNATLAPDHRDSIVALATDFPAVWHASSTTHRDRKRMVRLIIQDVTLIKGAKDIVVHVLFRGGDTRSITIPRPLPAWKTWLTPSETISAIDELLDEHIEAEIAEILNEQGFHSGRGNPFTNSTVKQLCQRYGLKSRYRRLRERGLLTAAEVAEEAGISLKTVRQWHKDNLLYGFAYNSRHQYLYDVEKGIPTRNPRPQNDEQPQDGHERAKEV